MKKLLFILLLFTIYQSTNAQIYTIITNYGNVNQRGSFDSTLFFPTGCGAPSGKAYLFSNGKLGTAQILKKFAIYGDSCSGIVYIWNPSTQTWNSIGSGGGGGTTVGPGSFIDTTISGGVTHINTDTFALHGFFLRMGDSSIFASFTALKDSMAAARGLIVGGYDSLTSQGGNFHTTAWNDLRYMKRTDSAFGNVNNFTSQGSRRKLEDSLNALITARIINLGAATGWQTGLYSARPVPTNCQCFYVSTDSGKIQYDNGTWLTVGGGACHPCLVNFTHPDTTSFVVTFDDGSTDTTRFYPVIVVPGSGLTSVGISLPIGLFTTSNNPLTSNGSIGVGFATLPPYTFFGNPNASTSTPSENKIPYQAMANETANALLGWDNSGNPIVYTAGTNVTINGATGQISATGGGGGSPGGSNGQVQVNVSSAFAAYSTFLYDGTTLTTNGFKATSTVKFPGVTASSVCSSCKYLITDTSSGVNQVYSASPSSLDTTGKAQGATSVKFSGNGFYLDTDSSGMYVPGFVIYSGTATSVSVDSALWTQQGQIVTVYGSFTASGTGTANASTIIYLTLPVPSKLLGNHALWGDGTSQSFVLNASTGVPIGSLASELIIQTTNSSGIGYASCQWFIANDNPATFRYSFRYQVQ